MPNNLLNLSNLDCTESILYPHHTPLEFTPAHRNWENIFLVCNEPQYHSLSFTGTIGNLEWIKEFIAIVLWGSSTNNEGFSKESFRWGGKEYLLKKHVRCFLEHRDNLWIYECPEYGLLAFDENKEEAKEQFEEEFVVLCEALLEESDHNLTEDAIVLKNLLRENLA